MTFDDGLALIIITLHSSSAADAPIRLQTRESKNKSHDGSSHFTERLSVRVSSAVLPFCRSIRYASQRLLFAPFFTFHGIELNAIARRSLERSTCFAASVCSSRAFVFPCASAHHKLSQSPRRAVVECESASIISIEHGAISFVGNCVIAIVRDARDAAIESRRRLVIDTVTNGFRAKRNFPFLFDAAPHSLTRSAALIQFRFFICLIFIICSIRWSGTLCVAMHFRFHLNLILAADCAMHNNPRSVRH